MSAQYQNLDTSDDAGLNYFGASGLLYSQVVSDLWQARSLTWMLALRDLQVRYRQTLVGVAWAVIQPVAMMGLFVTFFTLLGKTPASGNVPYHVSLFCGLLPWQFFSATVNQSSRCLVANQNLIRRVYFPRVALPAATLVTALADFGISFAVLILLMIGSGVAPTLACLLLPAFVLLMGLLALSIGLWLSAANALYRDVEYAVPFCLQALFFMSPAVYETKALVPEQWRLAYSLNPLVGVLEGFRWTLLGGEMPDPVELAASVGVTLLLFWGGLRYFQHVERCVADRI